MKRQAKQHLMNATREAVEPDLRELREQMSIRVD